MISKTLIKLIDQAIVPAILLLCTRVTSVIIISYMLGIKFSFDSTGFVFPSLESYLKVNSYSTFSMILIIAVGLLYLLIKALFFHDTHISPSLTAKLFNYRLSSFIQSSFELYSQGVVWLSYSFLLTAVSGVFAYFGLVYNWVFYSGLVLSLISTVILIIDVETEIHYAKDNKSMENDNTEELVSGDLAGEY